MSNIKFGLSLLLVIMFSSTTQATATSQANFREVYTGQMQYYVDVELSPGNYFIIFDNSGSLGPQINKSASIIFGLTYFSIDRETKNLDFDLKASGMTEFKLVINDNTTQNQPSKINVVIFVFSEQPVSWIFAGEEYYEKTVEDIGFVSYTTPIKPMGSPTTHEQSIPLRTMLWILLYLISAIILLKNYGNKRTLKKSRMVDSRLYPC